MEKDKKTKSGTRLMVRVGGSDYPAYLTNGALLRFKDQTGHDLEESTGGFSETFMLLWCCVQGACRREGVEFGLTLEEFADATDPSDIEAWAAALYGTGDSGGEEAKKKAE